MKILITDSENKIFANVQSFDLANIAAKAILKKGYSDLYYHITFNNGINYNGSIDLEPKSFHQDHINNIFLNHLKTYWGNVSRADLKKYPFITIEHIEECKKLLEYLPNNN